MRKLLFIIFIIGLLSSTALAADKLTFKGELTVNGEEISGSGTISMPKPKTFETQDDDPGVMAGLFEEEGYDKAKAALTIETSEAFTVSGSRVNGIFAIQSGSLKKLSGNKVPARAGDYYIGIDNTPEEEEEIEDAAVLQYIKISVVNASGSSSSSRMSGRSGSKYPAVGICTGDNVRIRNAPGKNSKVIGRADDSDELVVLGEKRVKGDIWY